MKNDKYIEEASYEELKEIVKYTVKNLIENHAKAGKTKQEVAIDVTKLVAMAITEATQE